MTEDLSKIPKTLKQAIGTAYGESIGGMDLGSRLIYTRGLLSLLRVGMVLAGSSKERVAAVDKYSGFLQNEIIAAQSSDEGARDGHVFKKIAQAIDFCGPFVFSGFGEVGKDVFTIKKIEPKPEVKP